MLNPVSGHNRQRPWLADRVRSFVRSHHAAADVFVTAEPGHATELAFDAVRQGYDVVAAVGGDGTVNEVAQALVHSATSLALVPCGSGNGLALHLSVPRSLDRALALVIASTSRVRELDSGTVNGRAFFNAMGLGLDAEVSRRFNARARRGFSAYVRIAADVVRGMQSEPVVVTCDGQMLAMDTVLLTVANSDQYGNHARIAPGSRADDGLLDLVSIDPVNRLTAVVLAARLFFGTIDRNPHVLHLRGDQFTVTRHAAGWVHTDGETHRMPRELEIRVHARSLRTIVPGTP